MRRPGRPTLYKPEYAEMAHTYSRAGAINDELAYLFNVSPRTVDDWLKVHPDFATAVSRGRAAAKGAKARRLYQRAIGAADVDEAMRLPPDVGACIRWLGNRRRQQWMKPMPGPKPGPEFLRPVVPTNSCTRLADH